MDVEPLLHLSSFSEPTAFSCPRCGQGLPTRLHRQAWVEVPAKGGWVAAYRLVVKDAGPVIAEARAFPAEPGRPRAGCWSGRAEAVPEGGLPGRVLGSLRLRDALGLLPQFLRAWRTHGDQVANEVLGRFGLSVRSDLKGRRRGSAGRPDVEHAIWARAYADLVARGVRHPIKQLSRDPPAPVEGYVSNERAVSEATIRTILRRARKRGLLSEAPPGRAGGELTAKGRKALDASS